MPRRTRRGTGGEGSGTRGASHDNAAANRVNTLLSKILSALQDQRDLRVDLSSTRARALLLDGEYVTLHAEYERALAARDRLDALSRELTRQNKAVIDESERRIVDEKKMREEIVRRFNDAMMDINTKLAQQSSTREQRDAHLANLRQKYRDLQERYEIGGQHFELQMQRKRLETRLTQARRREVSEKHVRVTEALQSVRHRIKSLREEYRNLNANLSRYAHATRQAQTELNESNQQLAVDERKVQSLQAQLDELQTSNATIRNENIATGIRIKAMDAEAKRLDTAIANIRETERVERTKREALEKLCRQVTAERAELHNDVVIMQEAWSNLKLDIEKLKGQVGGGNRVFAVLQSIMNRKYLDIAVNDVMQTGKTIEDAIREELSNLRLSTGDVEAGLNASQALAASGEDPAAATPDADAQR